MSADLYLFPTITEEMMERVRFEYTPYYFSYGRDNENFPLRYEGSDGSITILNLCDDSGIWNPDEYNLYLEREYSLKTFSCLFGPEGVACRNAELGLALMWTSSTSKQRGSIDIGTITNNGLHEINLKVKKDFDIAELRGSIELTTLIYLKKAGNPAGNEEHLANSEGYVLGYLDTYTMVLDGNGSIFPIYEVTEPSQPLWYVKCEWEDPSYDSFSECISIYINKANSSYKYLDKSKKINNIQLLKEIIASALTIVIAKVKESEYWFQAINGDQLQSGSVLEAVNYFISTLEWNTSSPELLSMSIRKYLDCRM